jgi:hypothetical protein
MVSSIAKHLNAYAGPEGYGYTFDKTTRRFNVNAHLTEREYREFFLRKSAPEELAYPVEPFTLCGVADA